MRKRWIRLSSIRQVQQFVNTLTALKGDFELVSGRYILDARSLMAILGLDLTAPLCLKIYDDTPQNLAALSPFMIETEDNANEQ